MNQVLEEWTGLDMCTPVYKSHIRCVCGFFLADFNDYCMPQPVFHDLKAFFSPIHRCMNSLKMTQETRNGTPKKTLTSTQLQVYFFFFPPPAAVL